MLPLPYDDESPDAVLNAQPVIASANPAMPGPVAIDPSAQATPFSLEIEDADVGDTLFVRVFRNYRADSPTPFFNNEMVVNDPVMGTVRRSVSLEVVTWCNDTGGSLTNLVFDVVVADRPFDPDLTVEPRYQAVADPAAKVDRKSWVVTCLD